MTQTVSQHYDYVVIGDGPGGIGAAYYLGDVSNLLICYSLCQAKEYPYV